MYGHVMTRKSFWHRKRIVDMHETSAPFPRMIFGIAEQYSRLSLSSKTISIVNAAARGIWHPACAVPIHCPGRRSKLEQGRPRFCQSGNCQKVGGSVRFGYFSTARFREFSAMYTDVQGGTICRVSADSQC